MRQSKHERIVREEIAAARVDLAVAEGAVQEARDYVKERMGIAASIQGSIETLERVLERAETDKGGEGDE